MTKSRFRGPTLDYYTDEVADEIINHHNPLPLFSTISPPFIHVKFRQFPIYLAFSPGDHVFLRPSDSSKPPEVAKVEKIQSDIRRGIVKVHVRRYYRPEDLLGGRKRFHSSKELFLSSDHYETMSADLIQGKCSVHSFQRYINLDVVGEDDFFWRFEFNSSTGVFNPLEVPVYCECEMPYNPDDLMFQCEGCMDWFHPECIHMTPEEAQSHEDFICQTCSSEEENNMQI